LHFFIKENHLATTERKSNMAKRKEIPRRGKNRAKGCKKMNPKDSPPRAMKAEDSSIKRKEL
jgi:hypothetical protein